MEKITLIIPTLWKSNFLHQMLEIYIKTAEIDEVILIDNSKGYDDHYGKRHPKIRVITPESNIFVNPSWNLGVKETKTEIIGILNDDIKFDPKIFQFVLENKDKMGILGMSNKNYSENKYEPKIEKMLNRCFGWGCMFFLKKKDWVEIPEEIKVWYGDDFIFKCNPTECLKISGLPVKTLMSSTSHRSEFNPIKASDKVEWGKYNNTNMNLGYKKEW